MKAMMIEGLMLALVAGLVVVQVFVMLNPALAALFHEHVKAVAQRRVNNTPEKYRELLEYAVATAYYAVEQFRKTEVFQQALAASERLTQQELLKQETLKRAKQILRTLGVEVPDDGLLMAVLDTLVERLIQQENAGPQFRLTPIPAHGVQNLSASNEAERRELVNIGGTVNVTPAQRAAVQAAINQFQEETGLQATLGVQGDERKE
jgi:hypothetical protein